MPGIEFIDENVIGLDVTNLRLHGAVIWGNEVALSLDADIAFLPWP